MPNLFECSKFTFIYISLHKLCICNYIFIYYIYTIFFRMQVTFFYNLKAIYVMKLMSKHTHVFFVYFPQAVVSVSTSSVQLIDIFFLLTMQLIVRCDLFRPYLDLIGFWSGFDQWFCTWISERETAEEVVTLQWAESLPLIW